MGWDDNGLPTERRVQNYYGVRCDPSLPYDPDFEPPAKPDPKRQVPISPAQLHRAVRRLTGEDEKAFEELWRRLGLSVDWSQTYRRSATPRRGVASGRSCATWRAARPTSRGADAVGRHFRTAVAQAELEDRELPGRLPPDRVPPRRRRRTGAHRDHPARADPGVRRAGRPPRRRALPAAVRHDGHDAAVRRRGAGLAHRSPSRTRAPASR